MSDERQLIEVDFTPKPVDTDPALSVKKRTFDDCDHRQQIINEAPRTVVCKACGAVLDPIDVLLLWARDWERYANSVKALIVEERRLREMVADLKRQEVNAKSRIRRARILTIPEPREEGGKG